MMRKYIVVVLILLSFGINNFCVFAQDTKYPDYSYEFLGNDKFEKFNRKVFNFNQKLNHLIIKPIHTVWSSIMPVYGMDRINGITNNIEFPIRLASSLIQRDFKTSKNESIRFFTNTVLGLGGMFDPARHLFGIEQAKENMEQALACCHINSGPFFVVPVLSFTSIRGLFGKLLDTAFNPTSYIGSPILAAIKAGLTINRTSYIQPLLKMVEDNYADPYEIARKAFGIDRYIKEGNFDRVDAISNLKVAVKDEPSQDKKPDMKSINTPETVNKIKMEVASEIIMPNTFYIETDEEVKKEIIDEFTPDIILSKYNPQNPVVDSMRTALFSIPEAKKSVWNELSVWNRSFAKRIKTASVNYIEGRDNYKYRYILQKDKNSPLAIIFPSIGEGITSEHSVMLGKIFYDAGYSVIIEGSHFQWEFVKSMPENYYPGLPEKDAKILRELTAKIIVDVENEHNCKFENKVIIGTSFGALTSLFIAAEENSNNTFGNTKYISICPPPNLIYAMRQIDKNTNEWNNSPDEFKQKTAAAAAKVVKLYESKDYLDQDINNLPFSEEEGKLITGFIMHQKLSDLIFTIENTSKSVNKELYDKINNMGFEDYAKKYLLSENCTSCDDFKEITGLERISDYLKSGNNYIIYHSMNDYLAGGEHIRNLKKLTGNKTVLFDNGAHLGFLYRQEFIDNLKNKIALN